MKTAIAIALLLAAGAAAASDDIVALAAAMKATRITTIADGWRLDLPDGTSSYVWRTQAGVSVLGKRSHTGPWQRSANGDLSGGSHDNATRISASGRVDSIRRPTLRLDKISGGFSEHQPGAKPVRWTRSASGWTSSR